MSIAIAKNQMAEMKLLGMLAAFDQSARRCHARSNQLQRVPRYRCCRPKPIIGKNARPATASRPPSSPLRPAFEDFDFTASRSITKAQIKELYSLQWLTDARPVLLIGQTGVGKTFIAQAAGLHACACGKSVLYMSSPLAREPRARSLQRHLSSLPRQTRQARL